MSAEANKELITKKRVIFIVAAIFWILPNHPTFLFYKSAFLNPLNTLIITVLWLPIFGMRWTRSIKKSFPILIVFFLLTAFFSVFSQSSRIETGLLATYYVGSDFTSPPAKFSDADAINSTSHLDPLIDFSSKGFSFFTQTFPLYFANDVSIRQPWNQNLAEKSVDFQFSAKWEGYISIDESVSLIAVSHHGGAVKLYLDQIEVKNNEVTVNSSTKKWRPIQIYYSRNNSDPPDLRLTWFKNGIVKTVPSEALRTKNSDFDRQEISIQYRSLLLFIWLATAALLFFLVRPCWESNSINSTLWIIFVGLSLFIIWNVQQAGANFGDYILAVGDDDLGYESSARDLLLGNWWEKNRGQLLYQNFAYPYLLAGMHIIAGESVGHALWFQQWLMSLMVVMMALAVFKIHGGKSAFYMSILLVVYVFKYSTMLIDTTFGIGFSFIMIICLLNFSRRPNYLWSLYGGLMLGISVLVRANFLSFIPIALVWLTLFSLSKKAAFRNIMIFSVSFMMMFSMIMIRNETVAGQPVMLPTCGALNLWIGNHPPEYDGPTYFAVKIPSNADLPALVKQFILADPIAFIQRIGKKFGYILGIIDLEKHKFQVLILILWFSFIGMSIFLYRQGLWRPEYYLFMGFIVAVNAPLVIFFPWGYGYRLSAPCFPLMCWIIANGINDLLRINFSPIKQIPG